MAQLVLISVISQDTQNFGDFVSKHDDKTSLEGPGYADFMVVKIPSLNMSDVGSVVAGDNFEAITSSDIDALYKADKKTALALLRTLKTVK